MKINLSQIKAVGIADAAAFSMALKKYIAALRRHQTTAGEEAPNAHPLIEMSVKRVQFPVEDARPDDFEPDFEIVDDGPTFDDRKLQIVNEVQREAQRKIDAVSPPLKRRLASIELSRAINVEEKKRTPAHLATIATGNARDRKIEDIHYHLATLEAEIHDLTEETIGQWQPKAFPA